MASIYISLQISLVYVIIPTRFSMSLQRIIFIHPLILDLFISASLTISQTISFFLTKIDDCRFRYSSEFVQPSDLRAGRVCKKRISFFACIERPLSAGNLWKSCYSLDAIIQKQHSLSCR